MPLLVARLDDAKAAHTLAEDIRPRLPAGATIIAAGGAIAIDHPDEATDFEAVIEHLEAGDAKVDEPIDVMPTLTASFRLPMGKPGEQLAKELHAFFNQASSKTDLSEWKIAPFTNIDLSASGAASNAVCVQRDSLFELHLPAPLPSIDAIKKFLMSRRVERMELRLCAFDELERLRKLANAKAAATSAGGSTATSAFASSFGFGSGSVPSPAGESPAGGSAQSSDLPTVGRKFLFTGKMASLTRDDGKKRVTWLGGISASSVSRELDYLVVGDDGSPLYGHGAKGDKIVAAERLQAHGVPIKIISEKQFLELKRR